MRAKAKLVIAKCYLNLSSVQKQDAERNDMVAKAETLVLAASSEVLNIVKGEHPLIALKFDTHMIEVLNTKPESPERTEQISKVCLQCVKTCCQSFGRESIHVMRPLYTAFTASLHDEKGPSAKHYIEMMLAVKVNNQVCDEN